MLSRLFVLTLSFAYLLVLRTKGQATSVPECALQCVEDAASNATCQIGDTICLCNASGFISDALTCASQTCQPDDQAKASAILGEMCSTSSVTSGTPGTSTGTFSGTRSGTIPSGRPTTISGPSSASTGIVTSRSVTATPTLSVSPTGSLPLSSPSSSSLHSASVTVTISSGTPSTLSTGTSPIVTTILTSTSSSVGNGVSIAPPSSQTSNAAAAQATFGSNIGMIALVGVPMVIGVGI